MLAWGRWWEVRDSGQTCLHGAGGGRFVTVVKHACMGPVVGGSDTVWIKVYAFNRRHYNN